MVFLQSLDYHFKSDISYLSKKYDFDDSISLMEICTYYTCVKLFRNNDSEEIAVSQSDSCFKMWFSAIAIKRKMGIVALH